MDKAPDAFRTISEVADELDVPQHVLRFWETRFSQIRPMKRGGGRRYYRPDDLDLLRGIRHLLYGEGYTIRGVQRILREQGVKFVQSVWQAGATQPMRHPADEAEAENEAAAEPQAAPAPRGLLGLLAGRRDDAEQADEDDGDGPLQDPDEHPTEHKTEPRFGSARSGLAQVRAPAEPILPPAAAAPIALSREHLRKLQASLHELSECRRLLESAWDEQH
jgi:DNA-binding transcriptional MerR regulator